MTSTSMPWVKLYTETLDDAKLLPLSESTKWRFVQLILLAGDCDQGGWLANNMGPITVETIALRLRIPISVLSKDLEGLLRSGLMVFDKKFGAWLVTNFEKRQGRPQSKKRELWRENKKRQRRVLEDTLESPTNVHSDNGRGVQRPEEEEDLEGEKEKEGEERANALPPIPEKVGEFGERSISAKQPADLPAPIRVYEANGGKYQSGLLVDGTSKKEYARAFIVSNVKDTADSLDLWGKVVFAYQAQWSAKSYTVMVNDYYLRCRIPGQSNGNGHSQLSATAQLRSLGYTDADGNPV